MPTYEITASFPTTAKTGETLTAGFGPGLVGFTFTTQSGNAQVATTNMVLAGTNIDFGGLSTPGVGTLAVTGTGYLQGVALNFTSGTGFAGPLTVTAFTTLGGTVALNTGNSWTTTANVDAIRFVISPNGFMALDSITSTNAVCFLEGTSIATPEGGKAVEALQVGDIVRTADGADTAVRWIGRLPIDTRLSLPDRVNPIRIAAGALAERVPERDLYVSPDHALYLGGTLINAGALVNGATITQVAQMPLDGFTYYHVETEAHQLLLAEGVAAESFVDYAKRDGFLHDGNAPQDDVPEMNLPRVSSPRLVPDHVRDALAARACLVLAQAA
jgi:hypothetical protein